MEQLRKGGDWVDVGGELGGVVDSGYFSSRVLYDTPVYWWDRSELVDILNSGVNLVMHEGHCNNQYCMPFWIP